MHIDTIFASVITSLANDAELCMLLAYVVSADDVTAFTDTLKDRLALYTLPERIDLFLAFASFCSRPCYQHLIDPRIKQANTERKECQDKSAKLHKKLVYKLGLNWKSAQHDARQTARFASARHIYLPRLPTPYPPRSHWVADTEHIKKLWMPELVHAKLHDKCTKRHPIEVLDHTRLALNVLPGEEIFIHNAANGALACIIMQNFASLPGPLAWVDHVVQESVTYRHPAQVRKFVQHLVQAILTPFAARRSWHHGPSWFFCWCLQCAGI
jgi:hypothetical protein